MMIAISLTLNLQEHYLLNFLLLTVRPRTSFSIRHWLPGNEAINTMLISWSYSKNLHNHHNCFRGVRLLGFGCFFETSLRGVVIERMRYVRNLNQVDSPYQKYVLADE